MCECDKGHWVRHEELIKRWGNYIYMMHIGLVQIAAISHMKVLTTTEKIICLMSNFCPECGKKNGIL